MEQSHASLQRGIKADVRRRMSPPHRQSVTQISAELGIHVVTLYSWRKAWRLEGQVVPASQKDPEGWGPADKFTVVLKTAGLNTTNQVWGWDITYLPTTVRGIWLYLYLVIDLWSRKVVVWDVAEREDQAIAADLVSRDCLRERISKGRQQPLVLHADNGNAMREATLESKLEELGVVRSFSTPRVSNDNTYSKSLFSTAKYRPD